MDPRLMTTANEQAKKITIWVTYICSNPECKGKARRPKGLTPVICPDCHWFMKERK